MPAKLKDLEAPTWTDFLAQYGRAIGRAQKVPGRFAIEAGKSMIQTIEDAKREAISAAFGGDFDPKPILELGMMPMGGTAVSAPKGALGAGPYIPNMASKKPVMGEVKGQISGTASGFEPLPKKIDPSIAKALEGVPPPISTSPTFGGGPGSWLKGLSPQEKADLGKLLDAIKGGKTQHGAKSSFQKSEADFLKQYYEPKDWDLMVRSVGLDVLNKPMSIAEADKILSSANRARRGKWGGEFESLNWRDQISPHATEFSRNIPVHAEGLGFNPHFPIYKGRSTAKRTTEAKLRDPSTKDYERGLFFAEVPEVAGKYGPVTQYVARARNPAQVEYRTAARGSREYAEEYMHEIVEAARRKNIDLLRVKNVNDMGGMQNQIVITDPSIVRLPHAVFDPRRLSENNLLGGLAGGGLTGLAVLESERERR